LADLAAVSWVLEALEPPSVRLDLSARAAPSRPHAGGAVQASSLALVLSAAGLPLLPPSEEGAARIDALAFLGEGAEVGATEGRARLAHRAEALTVALFVVSGIRATAAGRESGRPALELVVPATGLSLRQCWFIADRLAWLRANAVLVGGCRPTGGRASTRLSAWLARLVAAFVAEYGEGL
jgi:hypothetical protein